MTQTQEFAGRLNEYLTSIGVIQGRGRVIKFAEIAGLKQSTARFYLAGEKMPHSKNMQAFAESLGLNPSWLFFGEGQMISDNDAIAKAKRLAA